MISRYDAVFAESRADPEAFWARAAEDIDWSKRWDTVFDADKGVYGRWFVGAECNTCYNCCIYLSLLNITCCLASCIQNYNKGGWVHLSSKVINVSGPFN